MRASPLLYVAQSRPFPATFKNVTPDKSVSRDFEFVGTLTLLFDVGILLEAVKKELPGIKFRNINLSSPD
jgi:hypothetical protein